MRKFIADTLHKLMILTSMSIPCLLIASAVMRNANLAKAAGLASMVFFWASIELGLMIRNKERREP